MYERRIIVILDFALELPSQTKFLGFIYCQIDRSDWRIPESPHFMKELKQ